jgi:type I restriction enzyme M protein
MLDSITKKNIDNCRDILVGKVPDPKSQIEQITLALIYKFMDDMDREAVEVFKGNAKFFSGEYSKYSWRKLFDPSLSGKEMLDLYSDALEKLQTNPNIPELFRNIFKNAYLPYRDPATLKLFLKHIGEFEYSHSEKLGDAFEYLLSVMGSQGDAGQFRTPRHVIDFITACLNPQKHETVNDPACGTAGFLLSAYKHILNSNTDKRLGDKLSPDDRTKLAQNFVGYDISPDMVRLSLANMYLHGFSTPQVYEYDTLSSEDRWDETFDVILANPPFMTPKGGIRPHKKFGVQANKAEVLFTDYIAEHLSKNGRAGIVVPNGIVATTQTAYKQLRKMLVDDSLIAVISLPAGCFNPYSGVKTSILMLDKSLAKKNNHVLFIKIENDGFDLGAQRREHDKNDLPLALEAFDAYKVSINEGKPFEVEKYSSICDLVEKEKIVVNKDIVLSSDRYIEKIERSSNYPLVKLGEIIDLIMGQAPLGEECNKEDIGTPFVKVGQFGTIKPIIEEWTTKPLKMSQEGDVLLCVVGATIGKLNLGIECAIGRSVAAIRPKKEKLNQIFLYHLLKQWTLKLRAQSQGSAQGVIGKDIISDIEIPLPPIEIQEQIVIEIDGYQKIIDGAKMVVDNYKPTIKINPEWKLLELGELCNMMTGGTPTSTIKDYYEGGDIRWLVSGDIHQGEIYECMGRITTKGMNSSNAKFLPVNSVLIALNGQGKTRGTVAILKVKATCNQSLISIYPKNGVELLPEFLCYQLQSMYQEIRNLTGDKERSGLNMPLLRSIKVCNPNIIEQNEIVDEIKKEQKLVSANKQIITIFEQKIKDKINEVWCVKEEVN